MAQSITLKIAGKEFPLMASSPEQERLMRMAAEEINNMLGKYEQKYPDRSLVDKLCFVALGQAANKIKAQQQAKNIAAETAALGQDIETYLKGIEES